MSRVNPGYTTIDTFKSRATKELIKKKSQKTVISTDAVFLPNSTLHDVKL